MSTSSAPLHRTLAARHAHDVPAAGRAVLHALELALDDLRKWTAGLTDAEIHAQPLGLPSIAFLLRHIAGSVDRILTYAEGSQLSDVAARCAESRAGQGREAGDVGRAARRSRSDLQLTRPNAFVRWRGRSRHATRRRSQAVAHVASAARSFTSPTTHSAMSARW